MISQQYSHNSYLVLTRANLVWFNRALAWAMMVTPALQIFAHAEIQHWLTLDLALLISHAILSLFLFGIPKVKGKAFAFSMHVLGFRPANLSPRNTFLLTGYRVALGTIANVLLFMPGINWFTLLLLYPWLRTTFSTIQHLFQAITYALQRWRVSKSVAWIIVVTYFCLFIFNLFRV